jgi:hypothetical protein
VTHLPFAPVSAVDHLSVETEAIDIVSLMTAQDAA